jgi:NAD(P)-dependent dehydrogenase (short-subunit alcohol dehydrogenase family)
MGKLDGKVAIVTGAARGLGRAYAKRLAGLGAKVAVADLNLRSYEEFEAEAKDMTADSLFGTVYSCNAVASIMKQQRSGTIITVSSVAGLMAAMPTTAQRRLLSPITRGIWLRISGHSGSPQILSPQA